ncbi:hypothetical protein [Pinibacter soli]|uniref:DUF4034 domain-containing protein n=1 Tax=Pinibacter soli TaxID=3044211 RepID=A0ABT6R8G6_9BACT|nr:hypothetical protein [Pinibacter soli]MDI3318851.1 hypothetical protein [Pinibacter soli]
MILQKRHYKMKPTFGNIFLFLSFFFCWQPKSKAGRKEKPTISTITRFGTTSAEKKSDTLDKIVKRIAYINEVQQEHVGWAGMESENYQNFLQLKKIASLQELLTLTKDTNNTVECYAAWALADKSYSKLPTIFAQFIKTNKTVFTFSGCLRSVDPISSELYHRYWSSIDDKLKAKDPLLLQLDSVILYNENSYWLLMTRALENRVYPASYKKRIEDLAFNKGNKEALFYLCTWYRADNYEKIKQSLIIYLRKPDYGKTGFSDYYRTIDELLKFRDSEIEALIIQKLKKDKHWKAEELKFKSLLEDYSIYEDFD